MHNGLDEDLDIAVLAVSLHAPDLIMLVPSCQYVGSICQIAELAEKRGLSTGYFSSHYLPAHACTKQNFSADVFLGTLTFLD